MGERRVICQKLHNFVGKKCKTSMFVHFYSLPNLHEYLLHSKLYAKFAKKCGFYQVLTTDCEAKS